MRLHEQVKHYKEIKEIYVQGLQEIRSYLNSDKFKHDQNVNRNDILLRLNELDNALFNKEIQLK